MNFKPIFIGLLAAVIICMPHKSIAQTFLYGTTYQGGDSLHHMGTIFSFNPVNDSVQTLYIFKGNGTDGAGPEADLLYEAGTQRFYTTTFAGGQYNGGSLISFDPATGSDSLLWSFGAYAGDGISCFGSPVFDAPSGLFLCLTAGGGTDSVGALCGFNPATGRDTVLHSFRGGADGSTPDASVAHNPANGSWYGFAPGGSDTGAMFQYNAATNTFSDAFLCTGSLYPPTGTPYYDAASGLFYCIGSQGGNHNLGSLFSFNPTTQQANLLWSFGSGTDGQTPVAGLVQDPTTGLLYGMTDIGGSLGGGTIFCFNPTTGRDSVRWSFGGAGEGTYPMGKITYYPVDGKFYGMCNSGGTYFGGTIFSFDPASDTLIVRFNFNPAHGGAAPIGSLSLMQNATGIISPPAPAPFVVYPNPSSGVFTVAGLHMGDAIDVYNLCGQKLASETTAGLTAQIDLGSLANGVYITQVTTTDNVALGMKKVVIMH